MEFKTKNGIVEVWCDNIPYSFGDIYVSTDNNIHTTNSKHRPSLRTLHALYTRVKLNK